ncbi:hypothetical protein GGR01_003480, partial [Acetobacter oeni]|nr:hypothetical protein [Acetobacter oeni]
NNLVILRMVDDCPYPQSSAKNQSNRFLIQALRPGVGWMEHDVPSVQKRGN